MKHEEKINYMRIALGITGYGFNNEQIDLIVSLYDKIIEKKGATDLLSLSKVEAEVKERANNKKASELLDKVSKKISETTID